MATETVYTTGKSSSNARINIGSGALSSEDGQIAFPDECTSIKLVGAGSHADGSGTLLIIDSSGVIKKAGGSKTTIATVGSDPATPTTYGTVFGQTATDGNVILGSNAAAGLVDDATSDDNTAIGRESLFSVTAGTNGNTAVGAFSLYTLTTGTGNTAVGRNSGDFLTTGINNTFIGQGTLTSVVDCTNSIALGAGANITAINQLAVADIVDHIKMTGLGDAADGNGTLLSIDSSGFIRRTGGTKTTINTLTALATPSTVGFLEGYTSGGAAASIAVGNGALIVATGTHSSAFGNNALTLCTTGNSNTAMGADSLASNIIGSYNAAYGRNSLALCTSDNNTAMGSFAGVALTTGTNNTSLGMYAGEIITTGSNNTFIGYGAKPDAGATAATGRIGLGYLAIAKINNEFAIAPNITHIRAEGLTNVGPAAHSKMMYDTVNKLIRPMSGCALWMARLDTEYAQSLTSGSGTAFIRNLTPTYGSTSSWLTGTGSLITIPSGYPNNALWKVTAQAYLTGSASLTALSLDIMRGGTVFGRYATGVSSSEWLSYGGTCIMQLSPTQTIQMRLSWVTSGATSITVKSDASTYIIIEYLGDASTL